MGLVKIKKYDGGIVTADTSRKYKVIQNGQYEPYPIGTVVCPVSSFNRYPGFHHSEGCITVCRLSVIEKNGIAEFAGYHLDYLERVQN